MVDVYSDYIVRLSEARLADLRRETERQRLRRAVRVRRTPVRAGGSTLRHRLPRRVADVATLPARLAPDTEQRRSA